jgi:hypothetical protein
MGGLIDARLCAAFGEDLIFRDCRSLEPGVDFPPELLRRLYQSTVMLVIIGERWLTLTGADGQPRVRDPDDFVRWEIRESLRRRITVIPVLVDDAELPPLKQLPDDIRQLGKQQYVQVRTRYDRQDIAALVETLKKHVPAGRAPDRAPGATGGHGPTVVYNFEGATDMRRSIVGPVFGPVNTGNND